MRSLEEVVREFLDGPRLAVIGVSRAANQPANAIYRRLKASGHAVFAVNPRAEQVEGDVCYRDLRSIPGGVDGVVIVTPPRAALDVVRECRDLGIRRAWMHRSFGSGSVAADAVSFCRENGIEVIAGACPLMFCPPVDTGHKCMRHVLGWFGRLPAMR